MVDDATRAIDAAKCIARLARMDSILELGRFIYGVRAHAQRPSPVYWAMMRFYLRCRFPETIGRLNEAAYAHAVTLAMHGIFGPLDDVPPPLGDLPLPRYRVSLLGLLCALSDPEVATLVCEQDCVFMVLLYSCVRAMFPGCGQRHANIWVYSLCYQLSGDALFLELMHYRDLNRAMWFALDQR